MPDFFELLGAETVSTFPFHYPCILVGLLVLQGGYHVIPKIDCKRILAGAYCPTDMQD